MSEPGALANGELAPGVRPLDHTADVGYDVVAPDLAVLFHRAASGMVELLREGDDGESGFAAPAASPAPAGIEPAGPASADGGRAGAGPADHTRTLALEADDTAGLLALWLRELLYLDEVEGFVYGDAEFTRLGPGRLEARVRGRADDRPPVRELKGVTYHELRVERDAAGGWRARVIYDV